MGKEGYTSRRSCIAAAPVDELPPSIKIDTGVLPEALVPGMKGSGIWRHARIAITAVL